MAWRSSPVPVLEQPVSEVRCQLAGAGESTRAHPSVRPGVRESTDEAVRVLDDVPFAPPAGVFLHFWGSTPSPPQNGPKRTQTGDGWCAAGCCGAVAACLAAPIGHEASRTRTEVSLARSWAILGCFWPVQPRLWLPRGVGWRPGAKTRDLERPPLGEANPRVWGRRCRSRSRFSFVMCCLLVVVVVACSYYGERGVVIIEMTEYYHDDASLTHLLFHVLIG